MNQVQEQTTTLRPKFEAESLEELEIALQCARKIEGHLKRLVYKDSKVKYSNNLIELENLVSDYKSELIQQAVAV